MRLTLPLMLIASMALSWQSTSGKNIYVNSQEYEVDTLTIKHSIGPGTTYARYRVPMRPMDIFVLEVDISNPYIHMETWNGGDAALGGECPTSVFARKDAPGRRSVAAHNGDFYTTANGEAGMSRMGLYSAGECIFNATGRPLLVMSGDNVPMIDYVNFNATARRADGVETRLHTVNQLRLEWEPATRANQLSLYTPAFGKSMNSASTGGKLAYLAPDGGAVSFPLNKDIVMVVERVVDNPGQAEIPENGAVLHGLGSSSDYLAALVPGQKITLHLSSSMPNYADITSFREAIGGSGHIILKDGQLTNIGDPALHPRTFMGISQDRKTLYSVVVDGRSTASAGIDLDDEGRVLQWLGAWDGINLDGGGSSCVVVDGTQMNHPSDNAERAVGNGVIFYSTAPDDDAIASIAFEPRAFRVPVLAKFRPAVYAYNQYGLLISHDLDNVTLSCDPEVGTINERGEFVASGKVCAGKIYAEYPGGIKTEQTVMTVSSSYSLDYDTYIINNRREWPLRMSAPLGRFTYDIDPAVIPWTGADSDIAIYNNGYVRGGALNGTTTLTGTTDNFDGVVTLINQSVDGSSYPFATTDEIASWSIKQTGGSGTKLVPLGTDGWKINYTGTGTARGAGITITPKDKFKTFGIPKAISIELNPGNAPVTGLNLAYINGHGDRGTFHIFKDTTLTADKTIVVTAPFDKIADHNDNTYYPLTFSNLKFTMGNSTKGQEFEIKVLSARYIYDDSEGVTFPGADNIDDSILPVNISNGILSVDCPQTGTLVIYDMTGRICSTDAIDVPMAKTLKLTHLAPGVYFIQLNNLTNKILVR